MKEFIRQLESEGGHILDIQRIGNRSILYYSEYGGYPTDIKVKGFITPERNKNN